jgi:hypothetical protein
MTHITIEKEKLEQVLEALTATMSTHGFQKHIDQAREDAITTIKQALAVPETVLQSDAFLPNGELNPKYTNPNTMQQQLAADAAQLAPVQEEMQDLKRSELEGWRYAAELEQERKRLTAQAAPYMAGGPLDGLIGYAKPAAPVQSCYCQNCEAMGKELAALKAQQAHVPDLTHDQWDGWQDKHGLILERDALDDLRSMLAAQPAPVPLTPHQVCEMGLKHDMTNLERRLYELGVSDTEARHGITKGQP